MQSITNACLFHLSVEGIIKSYLNELQMLLNLCNALHDQYCTSAGHPFTFCA